MKNPSQAFLWQRAPNPNKLRLIEQWVQGAHVVDIGCGPGFYARHLHARGLQVTALDAKNQLTEPPDFRFLQTRVPPIPLPDQSADTALLFDVLEHVPDEQGLLEELRRVVRHRLILSVPADDDDVLPRYGLCLSHHADKTHCREYSEASLRAALTGAGFRVVHLEPQYPVRLPLVAREFFRPNLVGRLARFLTNVWLQLALRTGLLKVTLPADWLAVAERMDA